MYVHGLIMLLTCVYTTGDGGHWWDSCVYDYVLGLLGAVGISILAIS